MRKSFSNRSSVGWRRRSTSMRSTSSRLLRHTRGMLKTGLVAALAFARLRGIAYSISVVFRVIGRVILYSTFWRDRCPSRNIYLSRVAACQKCTIFNAHLQSCGTPGVLYRNPKTERLEPLGCWCYVPNAAATPKNCWLWQRSLGGWPDELNSDFCEHESASGD